jgi:hypothetical protein
MGAGLRKIGMLRVRFASIHPNYALLSHSTPVDSPALRPYHANIGFVNNFG